MSAADPVPARDAESGFTLIEMLVALAIFSLAALALLRLGGATAANSARLTDQALAQIVARNLSVELLTDPAAPAFGTQSGMIENAGRRWRWTRITERSPEARIQLITIHVAGMQGPGRATMTIFRRAGQ
ncbi:MAG TPA: type II secretion system minor pseudopilin GspI [Allosphingosinicella sp.]|jgi:general secretion pathway protein I